MTQTELELKLRKAFSQHQKSLYKIEDEDDSEEGGLVLGTLRWKDNKIFISGSTNYYDIGNAVEINSFEDLKKLITKKLLRGKR